MTDIALPASAASAASAATAVRRPRLTLIARSAALRAARTFVQSFLAVLTAGPVLNLDAGVLKAGATAGFAAVLTLAQRMLDDTPVPTIPTG